PALPPSTLSLHDALPIFIAENQEYVDKILPFADRLRDLNWIVVIDDSAMFGYEHHKLRSYHALLAAAEEVDLAWLEQQAERIDPDRKSTRLNSSHQINSY